MNKTTIALTHAIIRGISTLTLGMAIAYATIYGLNLWIGTPMILSVVLYAVSVGVRIYNSQFDNNTHVNMLQTD